MGDNYAEENPIKSKKKMNYMIVATGSLMTCLGGCAVALCVGFGADRVGVILHIFDPRHVRDSEPLNHYDLLIESGSDCSI